MTDVIEDVEPDLEPQPEIPGAIESAAEMVEPRIVDRWYLTGEDLTVGDAVYQAVGGGSACWSNLPGAGEFDSLRAAQIGQTLLQFLDLKSTSDQMPYDMILNEIRAHHEFASTQELGDMEMLRLTEGVGEAVQAWRRFTNRARLSEDIEHVLEKLADVIITVRVAMVLLGADHNEVVHAKLRTILERGGR